MEALALFSLFGARFHFPRHVRGRERASHLSSWVRRSAAPLVWRGAPPPQFLIVRCGRLVELVRGRLVELVRGCGVGPPAEMPPFAPPGSHASSVWRSSSPAPGVACGARRGTTRARGIFAFLRGPEGRRWRLGDAPPASPLEPLLRRLAHRRHAVEISGGSTVGNQNRVMVDRQKTHDPRSDAGPSGGPRA